MHVGTPSPLHAELGVVREIGLGVGLDDPRWVPSNSDIL